jgi:uncharacterized membrane protein YeaQ/YmgE (transglycosylase-associated protein family)
MGIISWIILGLIAGFIASKIVDKQGQGFWLDIALGSSVLSSADFCSICSGHRESPA